MAGIAVADPLTRFSHGKRIVVQQVKEKINSNT